MSPWCRLRVANDSFVPAWKLQLIQDADYSRWQQSVGKPVCLRVCRQPSVRASDPENLSEQVLGTLRGCSPGICNARVVPRLFPVCDGLVFQRGESVRPVSHRLVWRRSR